MAVKALFIAVMLLLDSARADSFVKLNGPGGQVIYVNPHEVTSIREPQPAGRHHFPPGIRCIVIMTNKNFITVTNTCEEVRRLLEGQPGASLRL